MAFSTYNSIQRGLTIINNINKYIFVVDASLVLFYPFDTKNTISKTPNYASSQAVYDGTMYGNSQITTIQNTYISSTDLSLNNIAGSTATNYIVTSKTFQTVPSNGLSISCWFSCSGELNINQTLFSLPTSTGGNGINICISGNNILSAYYSGVTSVITNTNSLTSFKKDEFHHTALSILGTVHTLYLDGIQVAQNTNVINIFSTYSTISNTTIGCLTDKTQAFRGFIGDFKVYNKAITARQVSNLYLNRHLVVHYSFNDSVDKYTPNNALFAYDASFVGTATTTTPNSVIGTGALSLTNTVGSAATSYVVSGPSLNGNSISLNSSTGLTICCWVNTLGLTNTDIMCLFDIPSAAGQKGLSVDICGNNIIRICNFI